ncbi:hypothetical protein [Vannielia sp.]|uniref:hypothetical protein n=1 Tax=Vannielia sp. TaxID=2813045 RepID=UPI00261C55C6|nr:hypothetical protein [Vannielia sp.]MDF1873418.1 hypothetical protein [Vannielia sp.]
MSGLGNFDAASTLVVPMQVKAQVTTTQNSQMFWERETLIYNNLNDFQSPVPAPFNPSNETPPSAGVHLHWALPRAFAQSLRPSDLTEGAINNGTASASHFRVVPNRYLVVRIQEGTGDSAAQEPPATKAWVLTSDEFNADGASPFVNPFGDLARNPNTTIPGPAIVAASMMGLSRSLSDYADAVNVGTVAENPELFLRAIGPGDVSFASFSPGVGNVFGFHDDLSDLAADQEASLSYLVLGWISDPDGDPLSPDNPDGADWNTVDVATLAQEQGLDLPDGISAVQVANPLGWVLPDATATAPTRTLVQAAITDVTWNGSEQTPMPQGLGWYHSSTDIATNIKVAMANSSAEAISELVGHIMADPNLGLGYTKEQAVAMSVALEAAQYHALDELDTASGRQLLRERIKRAGYESYQGGYDWELIPEPDAKPDPLSAAQQSALGTLQQSQRQLDEAREVLHSMQSRLYSLWWMQYAIWYMVYLRTYPPLGNPAFDVFQDALAKLTIPDGQTQSQPVATYLAEVESQANTVRALATSLPPTSGPDDGTAAQTYAQQTLGVSGYQLRAIPRPSYFAAKDPALVVAGGGSIPPAPSRALICSTASTAAGQLPGGGDALPDAVETQAAAQLTQIGSVPEASSYAQPWQPLYLDWSMTFNYACQRDSNGNVTTDADGNYLPDMGAWQFDGDDYVWIGGAMDGTNTALQSSYGVGITRRAFLTPSVLRTLSGQMEQYGTEPMGADMPASIRDEIGDWPLVSQTLTGLHGWLTMRDQDVNVAPGADIADHAGHRRYGAPVPSLDGSPDPATSVMTPYFFPVRTGFWSVNDLQIRDSFGLTLNLNSANNSGAGQSSNLKPILPPALTPVDGVDTYDQGLITAPPRLMQGARLDIRWLDATDDSVEVDLNPGTSPICGWLLPNHADQTLSVYDQDGHALGSLRGFIASSAVQTLEWVPAPGGAGNVPGQGTQPETISNPHLAGLVTDLLTRSDAAAALQDLMDTLDQASWSMDLGDDQIAATSPLAGDPVAVVRINLQLQLRGLPMTDQSYEQIFANPQDSTDLTLKFNSGGVENTSFDLRLGAPELRRDGVAAFFPDDDYSSAIAPQAPRAPASSYVTQQGAGSWPQVTPAPTPQASGGQLDTTGSFTGTVLMDPRGALHVTSGLVPRARKRLASEMVGPALETMALTIQTGPVLFDDERVQMPIPATASASAGGNWSWLTATAHTAGAWQELSPQPATDTATISPAPRRLEDGWLVLTPQPDDD